MASAYNLGERAAFNARAFSTCPRCKRRVLDHGNYGESGIYRSMHRLCVPCFEDEDREIEAAGTNNLPETLAKYGPANDYE